MASERLEDIRHFRRLGERLLTAGQPTEAQLRSVAGAGVQTVINLALPSSTHALPDERATVTALGMEYVHLPVNFEAPTVANFTDFTAALEARRDRKLLVHCAANWRVSAFVALYRIKTLGWPAEAALTDLRQVWEPDAVWTRFIEEQLGQDKGEDPPLNVGGIQ
jgi:protein tyrosine phosphatase (PTP) superfamily phosphohydrolase (DUF442 family)